METKKNKTRIFIEAFKIVVPLIFIISCSSTTTTTKRKNSVPTDLLHVHDSSFLNNYNEEDNYKSKGNSSAEDMNNKTEYSSPINILKDSNGFRREILFVDVDSKNIVKSINVVKNNPYIEKYGFDYSEVKYKRKKIKETSINNLFSKFSDSHYTIKSNSYNVNSLLLNTSAAKGKGDYAVCAYSLIAYYDELPIGFQTTVDFYNSRGAKFGSLPDLNHNIVAIQSTLNEKYAILSYGVYTPDLGFLLNEGISVYNLHNNKLIYNQEEDNLGFFVKNNLVIITKKYRENNDQYKLISVFNFEEGVVYRRVFTRQEEIGISDITNEGYVITISGEKKTLYFNSDFKNEEL